MPTVRSTADQAVRMWGFIAWKDITRYRENEWRYRTVRSKIWGGQLPRARGGLRRYKSPRESMSPSKLAKRGRVPALLPSLALALWRVLPQNSLASPFSQKIPTATLVFQSRWPSPFMRYSTFGSLESAKSPAQSCNIQIQTLPLRLDTACGVTMRSNSRLDGFRHFQALVVHQHLERALQNSLILQCQLSADFRIVV